MSDRALTRHRGLINGTDRRLTIEAAALISRRGGRPSNRRRSETFRRTVPAFRDHYAGFDPIARFAGSLIAAASDLEMRQQWAVADTEILGSLP